MSEHDDEAPPARRRSSYDALWERVDNQGSAIRALGEETAIQFRDLRGEMARANSELATSFKATTADIAVTLTALGQKFDNTQAEAARNSRPQYGALFLGMLTAIGVAVTVVQWQSALHDKPVDDKLSNLAQAIADVNKAAVTQAEYRLTADFTNRMSDFKTQVANQRSDKMAAAIDKLDTDIVPRAELNYHWMAEEKIDADLRSNILALQTRVDQLAPAGDVLKRLTDRQHELEMKIYGAKPPG